jgi:hypothetical protein
MQRAKGLTADGANSFCAKFFKFAQTVAKQRSTVV